MSGKNRKPLNPLEVAIRRVLPSGPGQDNGTLLTITLEHGFEVRCHENWGYAWIVEGKEIWLAADDLETAVTDWVRNYERRERGDG